MKKSPTTKAVPAPSTTKTVSKEEEEDEEEEEEEEESEEEEEEKEEEPKKEVKNAAVVENKKEEEHEENDEEDEGPPIDKYANEPRTWKAVENFVEEEARARSIAIASTTSTTEEATSSNQGQRQQKQQEEQEQIDYDDKDEEQMDALGILSLHSSRIGTVSAGLGTSGGGSMMLGRRTASFDSDDTLRLGSLKFDPVKYLGLIHSRTPFDVLSTRGVTHLQKRLSSKAEAIKGLVRSNFELFIRSKDTVDVMHSVVLEHELPNLSLGLSSSNSSPGSAANTGNSSKGGSAMLGLSYEALAIDAQRVFEVLLARKKEADHIRALLFALDRSKFLFRLPAMLRQAVNRADDEKVLQVHQRAKELLSDRTDNALFKRILAECDSIVDNFRQQLYHVLEDPSARVADIERVIGVLGQLGMVSTTTTTTTTTTQQPQKKEGNVTKKEADPVRYYLSFHVERLKTALEVAAVDYKKRRRDEEQQLSRRINSTANTNDGQIGIGRKAEFIRCLNEILIRWIPSLYGLVAMFAASAPESESIDGSSKGVNSEEIAVKRWAGRIPEMLGLHLRSQKQRAVRILTEEGKSSWTTVKVHSTLTAAVLFQQMMDNVRSNGSHRARDSEFELCAISHSKGKEEIIELKPYDRPYAIHKKWGKSDSYFVFRRRSSYQQQEQKQQQPSSSNVQQQQQASHAKSTQQQQKALSREFVQSTLAKVTEIYQMSVERVCNDEKDIEGENILENDQALLNCVKKVASCLSDLREQGVPEKVTSNIAKCLINVKTRLIKRLCSECVQEVENLHTSEDWKVDESECGAYTNLPSQFSTIVHNLLRIADSALLIEEDKKLHETVSDAFTEAVATFVDTLHHLVFNDNSDQENSFNLSESKTSFDTMLLRVLANCVQCKEVVFPEVLKPLGKTAWEERSGRILKLLDDLETLICQRYLREQSVLTESLVRHALCDDIDWSDSPISDRIPDFAPIFLLELSRIHADLHAIAPKHSRKILQSLLTCFTQSIRDVAITIPSLGFNDALNILSAAEFVHTALQTFVTEQSASAMDLLRDTLAEIVTSDSLSSQDKISSISTTGHKRRKSATLKESHQRNVLDTSQVRSIVTRLVEDSRKSTSGLFACFNIPE